MRITFPFDGYEHLGIGSLAAIALENGHSVTLAPLNTGDYIRGHKRPTEERLRQVIARIKETSPDIVAFSLNSYMADDYCRIAYELRKGGIKTLAGGPHATAEPIITMQTNSFDALIAHEAEAVFMESLEYVVRKEGTPPPWMCREEHLDASRPPIPDLETIPFPAKGLFYQYAPFEAKDYKIITSRGCPYRCIFCTHSNSRGRPMFRRRSFDSVVKELLWAKRKYNPSTIYFLDDIFTINTDWLGRFLRDYKEKIGLPFHAISHPTVFTAEVAEMLKAARCFKIRLGVQSLTPRIKKYLGRPETNGQVAEAIAAAKRCGITVEVDHLVNVPGETMEEGCDGIKFYNDNRPDCIKVYWLTPLPGTQLFKEAQEKGYISKNDANDIRQGKGLGNHSYLFYDKKEYCDPRWLGIHFLLAFLPFLPRSIVAFLVHIRADRFLRIPSFVLMVGIPRLFSVVTGRDIVGRDHIRRLISRLSVKHTFH